MVLKAKYCGPGQKLVRIDCPAGHHHVINIVEKNVNGAIWTFNNDMENPTFSPSINEKAGVYSQHFRADVYEMEDQQMVKDMSYICHFVVTNGMIYFCGDCTHDLKNQTLPLLDIE